MGTASGCSKIDLGTLQKLGLDNAVDKNFRKTLINASGDTMKILGAVKIEVSLTGCPPLRHTFQVLDSVTHSNILLGRDFMCSYGSVQFDFTKNKIPFTLYFRIIVEHDWGSIMSKYRHPSLF